MSDINEVMFLCERVMAELCSEFDDTLGGTWDYNMDRQARTFDLTQNGLPVGATMTAESIAALVDQGIDEVQVFKMYFSAWGKLLPEAYPHLKRS